VAPDRAPVDMNDSGMIHILTATGETSWHGSAKMLLEQDIETSGLPAFVFPVIERAQNDLSVLVYRAGDLCAILA